MPRLIKHANVSPLIAAVVINRLATLHELQTVYGTEDLYNFLEILAVNNHNQQIMMEERNGQ